MLGVCIALVPRWANLYKASPCHLHPAALARGLEWYLLKLESVEYSRAPPRQEIQAQRLRKCPLRALGIARSCVCHPEVNTEAGRILRSAHDNERTQLRVHRLCTPCPQEQGFDPGMSITNQRFNPLFLSGLADRSSLRRATWPSESLRSRGLLSQRPSPIGHRDAG